MRTEKRGFGNGEDSCVIIYRISLAVTVSTNAISSFD